MREQDMRNRVFRFLKARMRNMIMPATVGIGLSVGGCAKEGLPTPMYMAQVPGDAASVKSDVPGPDSSQPGPDLALADTRDGQVAADLAPDNGNDGLGRDAPIYGVDMTPPKDANSTDAPADLKVVLDGGTIDSGADLGSIITKYIAPMPDAGADVGGISPVYIAPVYSAITPDAAPGPDGLVVRYMAQTPDARADGMLATLYQAPVQS